VSKHLAGESNTCKCPRVPVLHGSVGVGRLGHRWGAIDVRSHDEYGRFEYGGLPVRPADTDARQLATTNSRQLIRPGYQ
jgi:hypothetical protein